MIFGTGWVLEGFKPIKHWSGDLILTISQRSPGARISPKLRDTQTIKHDDRYPID